MKIPKIVLAKTYLDIMYTFYIEKYPDGTSGRLSYNKRGSQMVGPLTERIFREFKLEMALDISDASLMTVLIVLAVGIPTIKPPDKEKVKSSYRRNGTIYTVLHWPAYYLFKDNEE